MPPKKRTAEEAAPAEPRRSLRISAHASAPTSAPVARGKPASKGEEPGPVEPNGGTEEKKSKKEAGKDAAPNQGKKAKIGMAVGDELPDGIKLHNELDEEVDVKEAIKEKGAVFFIYPKANTPGCTNQACGFRDLYSEIEQAGYQVFGLSMDGPKAQKNWQEKQKFTYHLLCDPKQLLIKTLGASKGAKQVQRSHYVFGPGGKLLDIKSPASPKEGPGQALNFIKSLSSGL